MKYEIGQVIYVLLNRETKICPVQVVEEITKRTLDGEFTNYIVKVGKKGELVSLSDMDGEVFESIEILKQTLHDKITRSVDIIIENTKKRANEWYLQINSSHNKEKEIITQLEDDSVITLPDGTTARIKSPFSGI